MNASSRSASSRTSRIGRCRQRLERVDRDAPSSVPPRAGDLSVDEERRHRVRRLRVEDQGSHGLGHDLGPPGVHEQGRVPGRQEPNRGRRAGREADRERDRSARRPRSSRNRRRASRSNTGVSVATGSPVNDATSLREAGPKRGEVARGPAAARPSSAVSLGRRQVRRGARRGRRGRPGAVPRCPRAPHARGRPRARRRSRVCASSPSAAHDLGPPPRAVGQQVADPAGRRPPSCARRARGGWRRATTRAWARARRARSARSRDATPCGS